MADTPARRTRGGQGAGFFGDLVGDLKQVITGIIRQEVSLARDEMMSNMRAMGKDAGMVAAGGGLAYAGLLVIMGAIVNLLANMLPRWLAAFMVGVGAVALGAMMAQKGRKNLQQEDLMPERTAATVRAGAESVKRQVMD